MLIKGIYVSGSGILSRSREIDAISTNIANSRTVGFKKDITVSSSFGEGQTFRLGGEEGTAEIGKTNSGVLMNEAITILDQGELEQTRRPLDLAIEGDGFFTLLLQDGNVKLTRNGQFTVREDGYLADLRGTAVLGNNGPIYVGKADVLVNGAGEVYVNGAQTDKLKITRPVSMNGMLKQEDASFIAQANLQQLPFDGIIKQGFLEMSNTDMLSEMTGLIESSRSFQSCSQIIKMMDRVIEKTVNEIGKI